MNSVNREPYNKREIGPKGDIYAFQPTIAETATEWTKAAGGSFIPPFCLEQVDDTNVKVKFGQVNGITPTDIETNIDVSMTDGTWSIYLDCTINDDGSLSAATVSSGTSGVPDDTSDHAYVLIGEADVASSLITAVRYSLLFSQGFVACGRDSADPATTPGTYYFFVGSGPGSGGGPPPP